LRKTLLLILCGLMVAALLSQPVGAAEFRIALRAINGIEQGQAQWQATIDYLNRQIPEHHFELLPIVPLKQVKEGAARAEFEFLLTNPSSYVEIADLYAARPLLTLINLRGNTVQTRFGSVIFVHAIRDDIRTLQDLRGKRIIAVSQPAFAGWRVAWRELLAHGVDPYRDLTVSFAGGIQEDVVFAVRARAHDAGVVRTDQLERMEAAGKIDMRYFRILNNRETEGFPFFHSTPLYPEWPFAVLKHVPDEVAQRVQQALLAIQPSDAAARQGDYVGWTRAADYTPVRELMRELKVGHFQQR
jgi:ABC-type phosphate/phosphonate transport system substrate-binding protein